MAELKQLYDEKLAQKEELKRKAEHTEMMLDRAQRLVSGLASERVRWELTVKVMCFILFVSVKRYKLIISMIKQLNA